MSTKLHHFERKIHHLSMDSSFSCVCLPSLCRLHAPPVSRNDDFCIKNEELCIQNKEFCFKNEEFCIQNDELYSRAPPPPQFPVWLFAHKPQTQAPAVPSIDGALVPNKWTNKWTKRVRNRGRISTENGRVFDRKHVNPSINPSISTK